MDILSAYRMERMIISGMDRVKHRPTYTQVEDNMPADIYLRERMGRCFRCYVIATVHFIYFGQ